MTSLDHENRKSEWVGQLSEFLVKANVGMYAGEGKELPAQRPGYKELQFPEPPYGDWLARDSYTGYFRAPGMTTVYFRGKPSWTLQYGGKGMVEGFESIAKQTYTVLKAALREMPRDLPIRGPTEYVEGEYRYAFTLLSGDLTDGLWKEEITRDGVHVFAQTGLVGVVVHRDEERKPLYPWGGNDS